MIESPQPRLAPAQPFGAFLDAWERIDPPFFASLTTTTVLIAPEFGLPMPACEFFIPDAVRHEYNVLKRQEEILLFEARIQELEHKVERTARLLALSVAAVTSNNDGHAVSQPMAPSAAATPTPPLASSYPRICEDIIELIDWVGFSRAATRQSDGERLQSIVVQLQDLLTAQGITAINDAGAYDARRHKVVKAEDVEDRALDRTIKETVQPGYMFHERIIRPQGVILNRLKEGCGK
jgi:hypothetical protein